MPSQVKKAWRERVMAETSGDAGGTDATYMEWLLERNLAMMTAVYRLLEGYLESEGEGDESEDSDSTDPE